MGYRLGIDLGTTFTAAAVEEGGRTEVVQLGDHTPQIPSAVFVRENGELLVGEAAVRRGAVQPDRLEREFKRRLGDRTPFLLGGQEFAAEELMARLLRSVVTEVQQRQGRPPERIALTHPANWGAHRLEVFRTVVRLAGVDRVTTLTEPAAAAVHYSSTERADTGDVVAVYDLGGGTFDAAVLRKAAAEFELLGTPAGVEQLGGVDFDDLVFHHVLRSLDGGADELDPEDPAVVAALVRLRRECTEAKEALSTDAEATVPVTLPGLPATGVRLSRAEFEDMIRADVERTVRCMRRALDSASVAPGDVRTVVLVGGSARIPLVAEALALEFGRPVTVSTQPKLAVALGAAMLAGGVLPSPPARPTRTTATSTRERTPSRPAPVRSSGSRGIEAGTPAGSRGPRAAQLAGAVIGLLLLAAVLALVLPSDAEEPTSPPDWRADPWGWTLAGLRDLGESTLWIALGAMALFVFAYAESVLRGVRRRRRARPLDVVAMAGVGAVAGVDLVFVSSGLVDRDVSWQLALVVLVVCATAGGLVAHLQAAALPARGRARRPVRGR